MTPTGSANAPEAVARLAIDKQLEASGWLLQHRDEMNLNAANAVAVREFRAMDKKALGLRPTDQQGVHAQAAANDAR